MVCKQVDTGRPLNTTGVAVVSCLCFLVMMNAIKAFPTPTLINTVVGGNSYGDGVKASDSFINPTSLAISPISGNLYIADRNKMRKFNPQSGVITAVAGNGLSGSSEDGVKATQTPFNTISSLARSNGGEFILIEKSFYKIKKYSRNGRTTTIAGVGTSGFSGDGGLAINAKINPSNGHIAISKEGDIYFAGKWVAKLLRTFCSNRSFIISIKTLVIIGLERYLRMARLLL